jgi:hypothetical protein
MKFFNLIWKKIRHWRGIIWIHCNPIHFQIHTLRWSTLNNDFYIIAPTVFRISHDYTSGFMCGIVILGFGWSIQFKDYKTKSGLK